MPPRKRKLPEGWTSQLSEEQLERVSQLIGMEFDEYRCRQAVFITANMDDAVSCCLDEDTFNERLQEFVQAADIGNAKEGLRRLGPRTAAANLSTVGQVPPSLKGNAGQGAKSSMAIVNLGTGVVASLPETPKPEQDAAGPVARAGPAQPPAQPPASPLAPPLEAAPLAADHERSARKYAEKLRKALASAPAAARVTLAQTMVDTFCTISPEEQLQPYHAHWNRHRHSRQNRSSPTLPLLYHQHPRHHQHQQSHSHL